MDRKQLAKYIENRYTAKSDFPWKSAPSYQVFRHGDGKWFGVIMEIEKSKVGIKEEGTFTVINLKNSPQLVGALVKKEGIFPAYHMNKEHWITVSLDGAVDIEELKTLIEVSFQLTKRGNK